jgi:hypothetical protein
MALKTSRGFIPGQDIASPEALADDKDRRTLARAIVSGDAFNEYNQVGIPVRTVTTSVSGYIVPAGNYDIRVDATAAAKTIYLPKAGLNAGLLVTVRKIDASVNGVTLAVYPGSGDTLNLIALTNPIGAQWGNITVRAVDLGTSAYAWEAT